MIIKLISLGFLAWQVLSQPVAAESNRHTQIGLQRLADISLSTPDPRYGSWGASDLCLFSGQEAYRVNVRDEDLDGTFQLSSGTYRLPCQVYFNDRPGLNGRQPLREGVTLNGLKNRKKPNDCHDFNANLSIEIDTDTILSSQAGRYHARFFVQISPE